MANPVSADQSLSIVQFSNDPLLQILQSSTHQFSAVGDLLLQYLKITAKTHPLLWNWCLRDLHLLLLLLFSLPLSCSFWFRRLGIGSQHTIVNTVHTYSILTLGVFINTIAESRIMNSCMDQPCLLVFRSQKRLAEVANTHTELCKRV